MGGVWSVLKSAASAVWSGVCSFIVGAIEVVGGAVKAYMEGWCNDRVVVDLLGRRPQTVQQCATAKKSKSTLEEEIQKYPRDVRDQADDVLGELERQGR